MSEKSIKETALSAFKTILDATYDGNPNRDETLKKCYLLAHDAATKISKMGVYSEIVPGSADDRLHSLELIASAAAELAEELLGEPMPDETYESYCTLGMYLRDAGYDGFEYEVDRQMFNREIDAFIKRMNSSVTPQKNAPQDRVSLVVRQLDSLTDSERLEVFGRYCRGCGCINVRDEHGQLCHCQNDE